MIEKRLYPLWFLWPAVALYAVLFVVPSLLGILFSFTDWSRFSPDIHFVGLDNFVEIFTSTGNYTSYLGNTLLFTVVSNVLKLILGLLLALALNRPLRGRGIYRAFLFFPSILSFLVVGLIFRAILHPSHGLVNTFLTSIGLDFLAGSWLADPNLVWGSIFTVDAWKGVGYVMVVYLAGLQTIPQDYYDAAAIDGAGPWNRFWAVTFPMLIPAITVNVVFGLTYGLRVFDIVYVLTNGGPGRMTEVLNTSVFNEFALGNYGLGTALSSILFFVLAVLAYFILRAMGRRKVEA